MARFEDSADAQTPPSAVDDTVYTPSVRAVLSRQAPGEKVRAWDLVKDLLSRHPEYGGRLAASLAKDEGPTKGDLRGITEWIQSVEGLLNPQTAHPVHGRLFIVALSQLDSSLSDYLMGSGFLDAIKSEIREPLESLFNSANSRERDRGLNDSAPLHLDNAAEDDSLGRRGFARSLATRVNRIWNEYNRMKVPGSFVLHLHGPWGSGKTSLLNLLRKELQPNGRQENDPSSISRWIVVDFNAWQHQRLEPPWWFLMDAVYSQSRQQLSRQFGDFWLAGRLAFFETRWRLFTARRDAITVLGLLVLAVGVMYWPLRHLLSSDANAKATGDIVALASTLLSTGLLITRSLQSGSAQAAQAFVRTGSDPMKQASRHFHALLDMINRPVIVFIDDLDRCQPSYVVHLLEGMQTLFYDTRIVYMIAADRRWLYDSFEEIYKPFQNAIRGSGRGLGSMFLEKAFELSVSLPRLSAEVQSTYWRELLRGQPVSGLAHRRNVEEEAKKDFESARSEHDVLEMLGRSEPSPERQRARRQAAVERLAAVQIEETTEFFLEQFSRLLERNPRSMKRLLNAYSVCRDVAILGGLNVLADEAMRKRLVLWTILCMRWPALEDYLVDQAAGRTDESASDEVRKLLTKSDVLKVLGGDGVGVALDLPTISLLAGLQTNDGRSTNAVA